MATFGGAAADAAPPDADADPAAVAVVVLLDEPLQAARASTAADRVAVSAKE
jgi:hypothetical protein